MHMMLRDAIRCPNSTADLSATDPSPAERTPPPTRLNAGDWVRVKSREAILSTLDASGRLDGLPFMPQMFKFCGQKFRVFKRAHKTCDTVNGPVTGYVGRWLPNGVHLDLRCDGQAYGGCQAACLIFWKEEWLEHLDDAAQGSSPPAARAAGQGAGCTEEDVWSATQAAGSKADAPRYACQATELPKFTKPMKWWDARQYIEDYSSGNASMSLMLRTFIYSIFYHGTLLDRRTLGRPSRWLYEVFRKAVGISPMKRTRGKVPVGQLTPTTTLNLVAGDLVRVKSFEDILKSIDARNLNRGLSFDAEMVRYCGKVYRVRTRVERFIDEATGKMKSLKTPAVILEGAYCRSCYSDHRLFCPRSIFTWWREIWLEKVSEVPKGSGATKPAISRRSSRPAGAGAPLGSTVNARTVVGRTYG
jgi:hypothetical protein